MWLKVIQRLSDLADVLAVPKGLKGWGLGMRRRNTSGAYFFLPPLPPRWGGMVLATSRKIKVKEVPLGAFPHSQGGGCGGIFFSHGRRFARIDNKY